MEKNQSDNKIETLFLSLSLYIKDDVGLLFLDSYIWVMATRPMDND